MVFFFAIHRVVNVVMVPNAMIGEYRNCFESAPGANVSWWSQCMDGWRGRNGGGGACGWEEKEGGEGEGSVIQDLFVCGRRREEEGRICFACRISQEFVLFQSVLMHFVTFTELEKCFEF